MRRVANKAKAEAKRLSQSIHSLQVNNALLHDENSGLQQALNAKKKHKTKHTTVDLQSRDEDYGGAVFWSPRKLREAREREVTKRDEAEQLQLYRTHDRDLKLAATLYKEEQADAVKVARQHAKEERDREKKARAEELAAQRVIEKQQREAVTAPKSHDTLNKAK